MNNNAIFAGTFDPFTAGHYDIARRAAERFDKLIVAVIDAPNTKKTMFTLADRIDIAKESLRDIENVVVISFGGFLVELMKRNGIKTFVRGLRNALDFEYEKNLFAIYRAQWSEVEGFYLMTDERYAHISSSAVREILTLGGSVKGFVKDEALKLIDSK